MVEGARLESVYTPKGYQGFESLTLRIYIKMGCKITTHFYFTEVIYTSVTDADVPEY